MASSKGNQPQRGSKRSSSGQPKKSTKRQGRPSASGRKPAAKSGTAGRGKPKKQYTATTRSVADAKRKDAAKRRRDLKGAAVNLPNWVIEEVERVTPRDRIAQALEALGASSEALADGRYQQAVKHGQRAKSLSPQSPTIRETIGLAAYRLGDWGTALSELRAYRRIAGETTHMPIEMDVLRAQGRSADVEKAWKELQRRGGHGLVMNEGAIVYASFLLDEGRIDEAWKVIDPGSIAAQPNEGHLRRYYVASRVALASGDLATARSFSDTIVTADPSFPGYEALEAEIARASTG